MDINITNTNTNDNNPNMDGSFHGENASYTPRRRATMPVLWDTKTSFNRGGSSSLEEEEEEDNSSDGGAPSFHPPNFKANPRAAVAALTNQWKDATTRLKQDVHITKLTHQVSDALERLMEDIHPPKGDTILGEEQRIQALATISQVPPFSYLPQDALKDLLCDLSLIRYKDGEVIVQQGDEQDQAVYVVETGRVMMVQLKRQAALGEPNMRFLGYLDAPAHFGSYSILFDCERGSQIVAGGSNGVKAYRMTGERFERLLQFNAFRLKLALSLRANGIFDDIERFVAIVRRAVAHEKQIDFMAILASYRHMTPAIHANLHSNQLDLEGWTYAIRRLPDSVTKTYVYLLAETVPLPFMHPDFSLRDIYVATVARRRKAFAVDTGKLLVILRDNFSDVLDFLSLLCAHIHESTKLRTRLTNPSSLDILHRCLWPPERRVSTIASDPKPTTSDVPTIQRQRATYTKASLEEQEVALKQLPLSGEEIEGLQTLWPKDYLYRIWDIVVLHENIQIQSDLKPHQVAATDRWAERIRRAAIDLLKCNNPQGCGNDLCIQKGGTTTHIISSNTTSVRNLLSPYILKNKTTIQQWGQEAHPEIMNQSALSQSDKLCALCNAYMKTHLQATAEQDSFDRRCFKTLRNTELTGIQVELIDLNALEAVYQEHDIEPDPYLASCFTSTTTDTSSSKKPRLLVNIDYAFGKQAEELISALSLLFGESLASVGVMGKAGGLQGKRGDIIVADYLIHQEDDQQTIIDNTGVDREALKTMSKRNVWSGGVLTVLGTLLQDTRLLNFYKKLYGCVSLEMEGSFYARELRRYKKAGLLTDDVNLRFLYYVSDTPLSQDQTETLSKDLDLSEVIPPQYAVTRALLKPALSHHA